MAEQPIVAVASRRDVCLGGLLTLASGPAFAQSSTTLPSCTQEFRIGSFNVEVIAAGIFNSYQLSFRHLDGSDSTIEFLFNLGFRFDEAAYQQLGDKPEFHDFVEQVNDAGMDQEFFSISGESEEGDLSERLAEIELEMRFGRDRIAHFALGAPPFGGSDPTAVVNRSTRLEGSGDRAFDWLLRGARDGGPVHLSVRERASGAVLLQDNYDIVGFDRAREAADLMLANAIEDGRSEVCRPVPKAVCTAMNQAYGFGGFRSHVWLRYSAQALTEHHERGYHLLVLPFLRYAYGGHGPARRLLRAGLEHVVRRRTVDLWQEMRGRRGLSLGRAYRAVLEPLCFALGWLAARGGFETRERTWQALGDLGIGASQAPWQPPKDAATKR